MQQTIGRDWAVHDLRKKVTKLVLLLTDETAFDLEMLHFRTFLHWKNFEDS
ncbi:MAG: hypothetical protein AAF206_02400 [Bacteroidota bacterium]